MAENESRYGGSSSPPAGVDGESQWVAVATDGSYAWHDHRAHWMSSEPPAGARGDEVLTGVIPLQVNGADVRCLGGGGVAAGAVRASRSSPAR